MFLLITLFLFGDVKAMTIPIDAILIVSLLMVFAFIGYFFNNILENETNKLSKNIDNNSSIEPLKPKLEDQLHLQTTILDKKKIEKNSLSKLKLYLPSKLLGLSSLTALAMGGASLLGLQSIQKSYEDMNSSQAKIKLKIESKKSSTIPVLSLNRLNKMQPQIQKIDYIEPLLSNINSSKYNYSYKFKSSKLENNFSF